MEPISKNILDLHCDTLTECYKRRLDFKNTELHFSLDRLPEDFRLCQSMAVYMPDQLRGEDAVLYFNNICGLFFEQIKQFDAQISHVLDTSMIETALFEKRFAAILTVEGGSALAGRLHNVERLYNLGVRMMSLTWNDENEICGGVSSDSGFTGFGREVVSEMERLGMAVDVSHLNDKSFWELCELAKRPFAASHSNSRAVCGHRRNLTDDMFREIARRGGVAGLNYSKDFIRDDGRVTGFDDLLRHVYHFLEIGGENALALGSDYDGTDVPVYLNSIDKIGLLAEALEKSGVSSDVINKILFENANNYYKTVSRSKQG